MLDAAQRQLDAIRGELAEVKQGVEALTRGKKGEPQAEDLPYPATMPAAEIGGATREANVKEFALIVEALGGEKSLTSQGIVLRPTSVEIDPNLTVPVKLRDDFIFMSVNPNILKAPKKHFHFWFI